MVNSKARNHKYILGVLMAVLLSLLFVAPQAQAARSICRTDPIVTLSNGVVLTMWADVETDLSNLKSIDYFVHVPPGLSVLDVVHPDPLTADRENFYFYNDQPANQYSATIVVNLVSGKSVKVHGYSDLSYAGATFMSLTKDGDSGRELTFTLKSK